MKINMAMQQVKVAQFDQDDISVCLFLQSSRVVFSAYFGIYSTITDDPMF